MNRKLSLAILGCFIFFIAWIITSGKNTPLLPPPNIILFSLFDLAIQGNLFNDIYASLYRVILGVIAAFTVSFILSSIAIFSPTISDFISGPIELIRPVPPIAWVPIVIMFSGIGSSSAITIVALGAFFPMWLSNLRGISNIQNSHIKAAQSLGARPIHLLVDIIIPSMTPYILHGLRLGVGMGWFSVVAAEMMGSTSGLGHGVQLYSLNLEVEKLYAYIFTIGILGFSLNSLLILLEQHMSKWSIVREWINE